MKESSTLVVNSDSLTRGCLAPQPLTRLGSCAVSSVENVWNSYILQLYVIHSFPRGCYGARCPRRPGHYVGKPYNSFYRCPLARAKMAKLFLIT